MAPLIVLIAVTLLALAAVWLGVGSHGPIDALRYGMAAMFLFTGVAHFTSTRASLVRMVPPFVPNPERAVTVTGVLEIAGAIALLFPGVRVFAAAGLIVLLIAMFPANAYAARQRLEVVGRTAMPLLPRALRQLVWIGILAAIAFE